MIGNPILINNLPKVKDSNVNQFVIGEKLIGGDDFYNADGNLVKGVNRCGFAIIDGELHILGGTSNSHKYHYKYNGLFWDNVGELPYPYYRSCAVEYNGEIHMMGSSTSDYRKCHYKWNKDIGWIQLGELPYEVVYTSAIVYENEIHLIGGSVNPRNHYKWNGDEWIQLPDLQYDFREGNAVIYNNEIYILNSYFFSLF